MTHPKKFTTHQAEREQHAVTGHQETQTQPGREFASVEEMLRQDAQETHVPEVIAQRVQQSVKHLPAPAPRAWWRRFFGA